MGRSTRRQGSPGQVALVSISLPAPHSHAHCPLRCALSNQSVLILRGCTLPIAPALFPLHCVSPGEGACLNNRNTTACTRNRTAYRIPNGGHPLSLVAPSFWKHHVRFGTLGDFWRVLECGSCTPTWTSGHRNSSLSACRSRRNGCRSASSSRAYSRQVTTAIH